MELITFEFMSPPKAIKLTPHVRTWPLFGISLSNFFGIKSWWNFNKKAEKSYSDKYASKSLFYYQRRSKWKKKPFGTELTYEHRLITSKHTQRVSQFPSRINSWPKTNLVFINSVSDQELINLVILQIAWKSGARSTHTYL